MNGTDFKTLREFNLISRESFCKESGISLPAILEEMEENYQEMPTRLLKNLSKMIGVQLLDIDIARKEAAKARTQTRKWNKLQAKNQQRKLIRASL